MVDTEKMLEDLIQANREFNEELDANQKGYVVKVIETNNPSQYESFPGYKVISSDDLFTKIRIFLRTNPLTCIRTKEKPRDTDKTHFMMIEYKDGLGGMVINTHNISDSQLKKIINAIHKIK